MIFTSTIRFESLHANHGRVATVGQRQQQQGQRQQQQQNADFGPPLDMRSRPGACEQYLDVVPFIGSGAPLGRLEIVHPLCGRGCLKHRHCSGLFPFAGYSIKPNDPMTGAQMSSHELR